MPLHGNAGTLHLRCTPRGRRDTEMIHTKACVHPTPDWDHLACVEGESGVFCAKQIVWLLHRLLNIAQDEGCLRAPKVAVLTWLFKALYLSCHFKALYLLVH